MNRLSIMKLFEYFKLEDVKDKVKILEFFPKMFKESGSSIKKFIDSQKINLLIGIIASGIVAFAFLFIPPQYITTQTNTSVIYDRDKVVFEESRLILYDMEGYISQISQSAWYGGSQFADLLRNSGFDVSKIVNRPITRDILKDNDVLILLNPNPDAKYSISEIDTIEEFVRNGGGLLLLGQAGYDSNNYSVNKIADRFGVSFASNGFINDITDQYSIETKYRNIIMISDIKSHEVTKNVSVFAIVRGWTAPQKVDR